MEWVYTNRIAIATVTVTNERKFARENSQEPIFDIYTLNKLFHLSFCSADETTVPLTDLKIEASNL